MWLAGFSSLWTELRNEEIYYPSQSTLSGFEEITHVQGQRRSPRKTVGVAKSHLESNPKPTRDAQRAQTNLVCTRTQRPHRDWDRTVSECLLWGTGQRLPRKCTGHSKHPLPTRQEKTLHMDITRWSTPKSDWLYSLQPKMEKLYPVTKNKTRSWLWLRSWTPYYQIQTEIEESRENR